MRRIAGLLLAAVFLLALAGCGTLTAQQPAAPTEQPAAAAKPPATAKPQATASAKPATVAAKPAGAVEVDREKTARDATWAPGQLQEHFAKHGQEGPWASESAYDAAARETIRIGIVFTYVDRTSNAERLGFYLKDGNRFTSVTRDGRRITTNFRPDRGEAYVRGLSRSTYR